MTKNEKVKSNDITFDKVSIVEAKRYADKKDVCNAILENDRLYTFDEVDNLIEKFMKGSVK